ncbi:MAG: M23 family metallopeptidase [Acidobacteriota bacterium]
MKLIAVLQLLFFFWLPLGGLQSAPNANFAQSNALNVSWEPDKPVNGSPFLFNVRSAKPLKSLSGEWQGRKVFFDFDASNGSWYGFAGVGTDAPVGAQTLTLDYTFANGARSSSNHSVTIGRAAYRRIALSVPRKFLEPDPETLERIKQDQELKRAVFRRAGKDRLWSGSFSAPIDNVMTEHFGTQRTFNGKLQSVHQGLDFRAATGTPVHAMNSGEVILARELFYEGGFVVIDHGHGLLTLYMHLSQFLAKEGDRVAKGQTVGLSGESGRATGPHLHVGARWQGVYVDPAALLNLKLP